MDTARTRLDDARWPFASGEMAQRLREHDWAATSLGSLEDWPPLLRSTVQLVLSHPSATIVLWGRELIQIYTDAYRDLMGVKHPAGLGAPTRECWPEVWHINQRPDLRAGLARRVAGVRGCAVPDGAL